MGASFASLSAEELGNGVENVGAAYEVYRESIISNGVSGDVLLAMVNNEDENEFKSFVAENLGITNKLHQTVLYKKYVSTLHSEEMATTSTTNLVFNDTLQRPPKQILSDLFKLQVIQLDPSNVAAAVDLIAAAIRASVGENTGADGITKFDVFLSYRVATEHNVA